MVYKTKTDMIEQLKGARSWAEAGVTIKELLDILDESQNSPGHNSAEESDKDNYISELEGKISRLTDTNKQLRAENKALKAQVKS